jgi:hypothetical protein
VGVVGCPVNWIEKPATARATIVAAHAHFLAQHSVFGKPAGNQTAEFLFDSHINFRDEVDQPLLSDVKRALRMLDLNPAGFDDSFDGSGEKKGGISRGNAQRWARLTIRTSMPPSGAR